MTKVCNSWEKNRGSSSTDLKYEHPFLQLWWSQISQSLAWRILSRKNTYRESGYASAYKMHEPFIHL